MFTLLFLLAGQNVVDTDRQQFETFWRKYSTEATSPLPSKQFAWTLYQWTQAQFSLGYCSQYFPADVAENMRQIPNEQEIAETAAGRKLLENSRQSFRDGMAFRKEVPPTLALCEKEMGERGDTLQSLTKELEGQK